MPISAIAIVFLAFTILFFSGSTKIAHGLGDAPGANIAGYAWSSNFGWVSMNCHNNNTCAANGGVDYGVNINTAADGSEWNLGGHAWSSNAGWISFANDGYTPPDNWDFISNCYSSNCIKPNCMACYNPNNGKIFGWARVVNLNNSGWIALGATSTSPGIVVDQTNASGTFSGWAWNGSADKYKGLGWLSFNCSNTGTCGTVNYSVWIRNHTLPLPASLKAPNWSTSSICSTQVARYASLQWTNNSYTPMAYEVAFNNTNSTSTGLVYDTGRRLGGGMTSFVASTSNSVMSTYGQHVYWWVRVWDDFGFVSHWRQFNTSVGDTLTDNINGNLSSPNSNLTFTLYNHEFPFVKFSYKPANPLAYNPVTSTDISIYYTNASPNTNPLNCWHSHAAYCAYHWSAAGTLTNSATTSSSTVMTFKYYKTAQINDKITDPDGYTCVSSTPGFVVDLLPTWKEKQSQ